VVGGPAQVAAKRAATPPLASAGPPSGRRLSPTAASALDRSVGSEQVAAMDDEQGSNARGRLTRLRPDRRLDSGYRRSQDPQRTGCKHRRRLRLQVLLFREPSCQHVTAERVGLLTFIFVAGRRPRRALATEEASSPDGRYGENRQHKERREVANVRVVPCHDSLRYHRGFDNSLYTGARPWRPDRSRIHPWEVSLSP